MKNEIERKYQVWKDYGSEGWEPIGFDTFTECVDFIKNDSSGVKYKITKSIKEESYFKN